MPHALSSMPAVAAGLTAAAGAVTMMTGAVLEFPDTAALMASAMLIFQATATLSKLLNRERRQTHRLPLGNASLTIISATALTISLDAPPEISLAALVASTAMLYVLLWQGLNCLRLTITVDEFRPNR